MTDSDNTQHSSQHSFKIVSLVEGKPAIGVNHTKPGLQNVYTDAPVQHWKFHKVGHDTYRLSINGYNYTGVHGNKVIASIDPKDEAEWKITYAEYHDAYLIGQAKEPHLAWTVPTALEDDREIRVGLLRVTASIPPQYARNQLFLLKRDD